MNQVFSNTSPFISNYAEVGDEVRVWLKSAGSQLRPQIVEGTLRQVKDTDGVSSNHTDVDIWSIVVIDRNGTHRTLDRSLIGSIEFVS